jgi:uncharacterized protein YozE (UPF0346 family)
MLFFTWIKRKYIDDTTEKGMLARTIKFDGFYFPKQRGREHILKYLHVRGASDTCIKAFKECWEEYMNDEGKTIEKKRATYTTRIPPLTPDAKETEHE